MFLRPLTDVDRDGLMRAAANPATWAGHPAHDRWKPEVFGPYFDFLLPRKSLVVEKNNTIIGASRFYETHDAPEDIAIGFTFIDCAYWGGTTNSVMKRLMLAHAFEHFDHVWFHIAPTNIRSQKAVAKLGARHDHDAVLDHAGKPALSQCWVLGRL
ncbi:GNAT family N-acetyltransferase [Falsirhodobacter deserti]|uniref:GNAT family N-acetyltransferase n=1 Tax=Falsirhodobacter deserti TaxID=1365611 RepID=UPI000FE3E02E|nr:GNAT family N-acetyltransferase [Falsirhodobacter deserti]